MPLNTSPSHADTSENAASGPSADAQATYPVSAENEYALRIEALENELREKQRIIDTMLNSRSWKITAPLRKAKHHGREALRTGFFNCAAAAGLANSRLRKIARKSRPTIALITVSRKESGNIYRIERLARALAPAYDVRIFEAGEIKQNLWRAYTADIIWIFRVEAFPLIMEIIRAARLRGAKIIYDIDDLCFHPDYFIPQYMDAIRHNRLDPLALREYGTRMHTIVKEADMCCGTTDPLARELYAQTGKPVFVLRNTFDAAFRNASVNARRQYLQTRNDNLVRIGYAAGTLTHQADFARVVPALVTTLKKHPEARLVLFKSIDLSEMPALDEVMDQVEIRELVSQLELPKELARFDIAIAPLEAGNPFCEAKSELKFFESALMAVPTIASPTEPFRQAISHGKTGFLADSPAEWEEALELLLSDPDLRERIGKAAQRSVLWRFGPEYLRKEATAIINYVLAGPRERADIFSREQLCRKMDGERGGEDIATGAYDLVYSSAPAMAKIAVVIPLYNYANYIVEALDSLAAQTTRDFDLIVVNDASTDNSEHVAQQWLEKNASKFASVNLLRHKKNMGLSISRNTGIDFSGAEFIMLLDADNQLLPSCIAECTSLLADGNHAFVFPKIEIFGESRDFSLISAEDWNPVRLRHGNYIDAMAMLKKAAWAAVGGFTVQDLGWEDYDLWCKFVERGFYGLNSATPLARYRVHSGSMLDTKTDRENSKQALKEIMSRNHPWLLL